MKEAKGDIFSLPTKRDYTEAICITTNGIIRNNGRAVMGAGVAKAFRDRFPGIDKNLATHILQCGNVPGNLGVYEGCLVLSFPTKYHWSDNSDLELIQQSAKLLREMVDNIGVTTVYLPRPGCANGHLNWDDVKASIEPYFDDRFIIVTL